MRVGFLLNGYGSGWLGGKNYYRNLISAILALPNRKIQPVIVTGAQEGAFFQEFPAIEILSTDMLSQGHPMARIRRKTATWFAKDWLLELFLRAHQIDVVSHAAKSTAIPTAGWVADFQHVHLKHFFSEEERGQRDRDYTRLCRECDRVIVSSESAKMDLEAFAPKYSHKAEVLRFVANPEPRTDTPEELADLRRRYDVDEGYFLLPNQFWAHKNHRIVIDALSILQERGKKVLVLATGSTEDYRNPDFYKELMRYAQERKVLGSFRVLGIVPFDDLTALMRNAIAFINPSRFEGWSTTVEEAKSLGKSIIISDISVHREQAPERGTYFPPDDAPALAELLWTTWTSYSAESDLRMRERAQRSFPDRQIEFALRYQEIILKTLESNT